MNLLKKEITLKVMPGVVLLVVGSIISVIVLFYTVNYIMIRHDETREAAHTKLYAKAYMQSYIELNKIHNPCRGLKVVVTKYKYKCGDFSISGYGNGSFDNTVGKDGVVLKGGVFSSMLIHSLRRSMERARYKKYTNSALVMSFLHFVSRSRRIGDIADAANALDSMIKDKHINYFKYLRVDYVVWTAFSRG